MIHVHWASCLTLAENSDKWKTIYCSPWCKKIPGEVHYSSRVRVSWTTSRWWPGVSRQEEPGSGGHHSGVCLKARGAASSPVECDLRMCWDRGRYWVLKFFKGLAEGFRICLVESHWRIWDRRIAWSGSSFRKLMHSNNIAANILAWGEIWGAETRLGVLLWINPNRRGWVRTRQ